MKPLRSILVATDSRLEDQSIVETAAATARHYRASLTIVDVVQDLGWATRLGAQDVDSIREALRATTGDRLSAIATQALEHKAEVTTKLLEGKTSLCIVREVLRHGHDLVMAVSKGKNSKNQGIFGQTSRQLLRNCPCPLWLVPPGTMPRFKRVLACVDTTSGDPVDALLNENIYSLAAAVSEQFDSRLAVLHAWHMDNEAFLSARLRPELVAGFESEDIEYRQQLLDKFVKQFKPTIAERDVHLVKGDIGEAVAAFVDARNIDLVVMGTIGRSGLTGLLVGNTAEKILDRIKCSVLAIKPKDFKCPIK